MSREIKFRAWDKKEIRMYEVFSFCKDYVKVIAEGVGDGILKYSIKDFELMQFTGLKDKNEKEVYEGDIVDAGYGRAKVVFNSGCFMLEWIYDTEASMEILGIDRNMRRNRLLIEVIGNIYETPELLNSELKDIK